MLAGYGIIRFANNNNMSKRPHKGKPPESGTSPGAFFAYRLPVCLSIHLLIHPPITLAKTDTIRLTKMSKRNSPPFLLIRTRTKDGTKMIPYFDNIRKEAIPCPRKS